MGQADAGHGAMGPAEVAENNGGTIWDVTVINGGLIRV
jgi:hypothetical protein